MQSNNVCMFIGNLTRDVEVRFTPNGVAVANVGMAINRRTKDKEEVSFIDLVAWDRNAEVLGEYAQKGTKISVLGEVRQESWENEAGEKRSRLTFVINNFQLLSAKKDGGEETDKPAKPAPKKSTKKTPPPEEDVDTDMDEIPF